MNLPFSRPAGERIGRVETRIETAQNVPAPKKALALLFG
jgi:hypothetical protein